VSLVEHNAGVALEEVDRIAAAANVTRQELIESVRRALASDPLPKAPEFTVRIAGAPIATNRAYAPVAFRLKGSPKWVARIRLTDQGERWRDLVRDQVLAARVRFARDWRTDGESYEVRIVYDFASHASDIDGPIKLTLDALQRAVYEDDRQVSHLDVVRRVNTMHPGVEITLRMLRDGPSRQGALRL
jgi:Holliday junction resolvase RusA-like endonuclease